MKRNVLALMAAAVLLFPAQPARADTYFFTYEYYNDSEFTQLIGLSYTNCQGSCVEGCSMTGPYRIVEKESCNTGQVVLHYCQRWTGSSWQSIQCP